VIGGAVIVTVAGGLAYESVALRWRRCPTITHVVHRHRHRWAVAVGVVAAVVGPAAWALWHLLFAGECPYPCRRHHHE
jgi:hypothetical protein